MWSGTATTNAAGLAAFVFPAGLFTAPTVVATEIQGGTSNAKMHKLTALSSAGATVQVLSAAGVTVLGVGVLATAQPESGVIVHLVATEAGA